ncbi:unnamed protein product, partial [Oikopleura dioica]
KIIIQSRKSSVGCRYSGRLSCGRNTMRARTQHFAGVAKRWEMIIDSSGSTFFLDFTEPVIFCFLGIPRPIECKADNQSYFGQIEKFR